MSRIPRRRAPRTMAAVLGDELRRIAPTDPLSRLQAEWPQIVGRVYAAHSSPTHLRRDGAVAVRCDSGTMANELTMREAEFADRISQLLDLTLRLRFQGPAGRG